MARKKRPSLLQQQRAKLKAQKAAKAQRQGQAKTPRLPGKGGTSAKSVRARVQRGVRRDALAKKQITDFGRALKKTLKQGAAQDKLKKAAKGTKGTGVRTAGAGGGLAKSKGSKITKYAGKKPAGKLAKRGGIVKAGSSTATDGRIKKVNVKVNRPGDNAKKIGSGSSSRAGLKGGKGVKGLLKGGRGLLGKAGAVGLALSGVAEAGELYSSLKRGEGYAALPGLNKKLNKGIKGRGVKGKGGPVKPAKRGMSNIPPGEGTGKGSPNDKKSPVKGVKKGGGTYAPKGGKRSPAGGSSPASKGKNPYRKPEGSERKDKSYKAVQELRGMIKGSKARQNAQMPKKPKKKTISRNERNLRRRRGM